MSHNHCTAVAAPSLLVFSSSELNAKGDHIVPRTTLNFLESFFIMWSSPQAWTVVVCRRAFDMVNCCHFHLQFQFQLLWDPSKTWNEDHILLVLGCTVHPLYMGIELTWAVLLGRTSFRQEKPRGPSFHGEMRNFWVEYGEVVSLSGRAQSLQKTVRGSAMGSWRCMHTVANSQYRWEPVRTIYLWSGLTDVVGVCKTSFPRADNQSYKLNYYVTHWCHDKSSFPSSLDTQPTPLLNLHHYSIELCRCIIRTTSRLNQSVWCSCIHETSIALQSWFWPILVANPSLCLGWYDIAQKVRYAYRYM